MQIAREMSFQISAESSLTEPYIAHMLSKALTSESALFIGNSMPIRDVDMYGCSSENSSHVVDMMLSAELPCQWIQVTGNRGASGIDGLLSSATGFAVGCKKRVRFELIFSLLCVKWKKCQNHLLMCFCLPCQKLNLLIGKSPYIRWSVWWGTSLSFMIQMDWRF